jgi:hypothetical protein
MRPINTLSLSILITLFGCGVEGNGRLVSDARDTPEFTRIAVGGGLHVEATIGPQRVELTIDENLLRYVDTVVVDGELRVETRDGYNLDPSDGAGVVIASPVLTGVGLSGGCQGSAEVSPSEHQVFKLSGASELTVPNVDAQFLDVELSGSSDLNLTGHTEELDAHESGTSSLESQVTAATVTIEMSGASDTKLHASQSVTGHLSGASHLVVSGSPTMREIETSGLSWVRFDQ